MQKLRSFLGYSWALLSVPFVLLLLMSSQGIYQNTFEKRGLKVTDRISGGKVTKILQRENYSVHLHRPVFDGLFTETKSGFVQIDFISQTNLPSRIRENIDYDLDSEVDFFFSIDTQSNTYRLVPKTGGVKSLSQEGIYVLDKRRTIRVEIEK